MPIVSSLIGKQYNEDNFERIANALINVNVENVKNVLKQANLWGSLEIDWDQLRISSENEDFIFECLLSWLVHNNTNKQNISKHLIYFKVKSEVFLILVTKVSNLSEVAQCTPNFVSESILLSNKITEFNGWPDFKYQMNVFRKSFRLRSEILDRLFLVI